MEIVGMLTVIGMLSVTILYMLYVLYIMRRLHKSLHNYKKLHCVCCSLNNPISPPLNKEDSEEPIPDEELEYVELSPESLLTNSQEEAIYNSMVLQEKHPIVFKEITEHLAVIADMIDEQHSILAIVDTPNVNSLYANWKNDRLAQFQQLEREKYLRFVAIYEIGKKANLLTDEILKGNNLFSEIKQYIDGFEKAFQNDSKSIKKPKEKKPKKPKLTLVKDLKKPKLTLAKEPNNVN